MKYTIYNDVQSIEMLCTKDVYKFCVCKFCEYVATIIESSNASTDDAQKTNKDDEKPENGPSEANSADK